MTHMGRILKTAAHFLCGLVVVAVSPLMSIATDAESAEFPIFFQDRSPVLGSIAPPAAATKLHDIRTGMHSGFTRLVFDSEGARPLR